MMQKSKQFLKKYQRENIKKIASDSKIETTNQWNRTTKSIEYNKYAWAHHDINKLNKSCETRDSFVLILINKFIRNKGYKNDY